jgi:single-strand DNA-binding protein
MNTLRNKVQLIGNLGNDPQVFLFENGNKKASVSLATNESYTNKAGEKVEHTQWHNIVFYGKTADIVEKFLSKGSEVAIEGKIASRSFENKEGETRYVTEVIANEMLMIGRKN